MPGLLYIGDSLTRLDVVTMAALLDSNPVQYRVYGGGGGGGGGGGMCVWDLNYQSELF